MTNRCITLLKLFIKKHNLYASIFIFFTFPTDHCNSSEMEPNNYSFTIINSYPHDTKAFTQGLEWDDGKIYEGTGLRGKSSLRRVLLESGQVEKHLSMGRNYFGEGITVLGDKIYQLTWKSKIIFIYDKKSLSLIDSKPYPKAGWGLTNDTKSLIASDGSANLYFLDPDTLSIQRTITVHDQTSPVRKLNELEYVNGEIFANLYKSDKVAIISPQNGAVLGWIDFSELKTLANVSHKEAVLNGIMYDQDRDRLFVTGKYWPKIFEIQLHEVK